MKKQKQTNQLKNVTIVFGYSLFAFSLLAITLSTVIPFGSIYFNPASRHLNVAILLISLVSSAVLPPLLSYIIGDQVTHAKNKANHHFNGVLFGIAAYWVALFFSFVMSETITKVRDSFAEPLATIINGWPIVATIVIMAIVAFSYAHHQKKNSTVLEYKPYQIILLTSILGMFAYSLVLQHFYSDSNLVVSLLSILIPTVIVAVSYRLLGQYNPVSTRLTLSLVAMSIGYITVSVAAQLVTDPSPNISAPITMGVLSIVTYLLLIRRG
jgi:hypothetical protein